MNNNIGREFMQATTHSSSLPTSPSPQQQGLPQPPLELPIPEEAHIITLPKPPEPDMGKIDLRQVIETRRSLRRYAPDPLTLGELSYLLWLTQGVKGIIKRPATLRNVPSAGARHAFETILLVNRVENIHPGLYRYGAGEHILAEMPSPPDIAERLTRACMMQSMVLESAVTFFWVAIVERMFWRYAERGYRYLHLDAGHVCQNLYLAAEAIYCGVCAIAAFFDDDVNACLGVDGTEQFTIYIGSVGKKPV